jgi:hypothetical protein
VCASELGQIGPTPDPEFNTQETPASSGGQMMSRRRWILLLLVAAVATGVWWARRKPSHFPDAYIGDRSATLWSATAQVRRQVATLGYGEKVNVLARAGDLTEVRASDGTQGWVDSHLLMAPELWSQVGQLVSSAQTMPIQAKGHTRTISNVHIEPSRDSPRIFQFGRNVPLAVLRRQVAAAPQSSSEEGHASDEAASSPGEKSDREDWSLILYSPPKPASSSSAAGSQSDSGPSIPIAGWVLSRFVELDPPPPVGDYTSAAGRRVVAWLQLDTVPDPSGDKPQYVVAAAKGGEGQPCDFTSIRVYTWGARRMQYETSFADNKVCGRLPVRVTQTTAGPEFRFSDDNNVERAYRLLGTVVRRLTPAGTVRRPR